MDFSFLDMKGKIASLLPVIEKGHRGMIGKEEEKGRDIGIGGRRWRG